MENYYETLGISEEASEADIKKGYFKMVRKYPPESDEKNFKRVREAYEILSNAQTKKEYDEVMTLSPVLRDNFLCAKQELEQGQAASAIKRLLEIQKSVDADFINVLIADAYMFNGNSGKCINILESLVNKHPKSSMYKGKLGSAYVHRGWHKKAIPLLEDALKLGNEDIGNWLALSEAYIRSNEIDKSTETLEKGIETHSDIEMKSILYFYKWINKMTIFLFWGDEEEEVELVEEISAYVTEVERQSKEKPELKELIGTMFFRLAHEAAERECMEVASVCIDCIPKLMKVTKEVQTFIDEFMTGINMKKMEDMLMEDERFDEEFVMTLLMQATELESIKEDKEFFNMEKTISTMEFAINYKDYIGQIQILKAEYPQIYEKVKDFIEQMSQAKVRDKILRNKKNIRQMKQYISMLEQQEEMEDWEDWEDEEDWEMPQQPILRSSPKIGRNDPCPCGSGKKYKQCCGKNR